MAGERSGAARQAEQILAEALEPLAAELRLVDPADYVAFIRLERFANLRDLVESSIEPFFTPSALTYAFDAGYSLDWGAPPSVSLDLKFEFDGLRAAFTLRFDGTSHRVALRRLEPQGEDADCAARLRAALKKARAG